MLEFIFQILAFFKTFFVFTILSYIYKCLYSSCSEKKIIKTKDEKPKKVIKTKIGLSFIYLALLIMLYYSLTFYVMLTLILIVLTSVTLLTHKFEPSLLDIFKKYDSHPMVKRVWYFYSFIVNVTLKIMGPFHTFLENKISKNKQLIYDKFYDRFLKKDINPMDLLFSGGIMKNLSLLSNINLETETNKNTEDDFSKINDFLKKQNKNQKIVELDFKNRHINAENSDEIQDYLDNIKQKMNKVTHVSTINNSNNDGNNDNNNEDLSAFIKKSEIFSSGIFSNNSDDNMTNKISDL